MEKKTTSNINNSNNNAWLLQVGREEPEDDEKSHPGPKSQTGLDGRARGKKKMKQQQKPVEDGEEDPQIRTDDDQEQKQHQQEEQSLY